MMSGLTHGDTENHIQGWLFLFWVNLIWNPFIDILREVCLLGDCNPRQVDDKEYPLQFLVLCPFSIHDTFHLYFLLHSTAPVFYKALGALYIILYLNSMEGQQLSHRKLVSCCQVCENAKVILWNLVLKLLVSSEGPGIRDSSSKSVLRWNLVCALNEKKQQIPFLLEI